MGSRGVPDVLVTPDWRGRRDALRGRLDVAGGDLMLVTDPANVRYLSGFSGSNGQVLIGGTGEDRLVTDGRYEQRAAVEAPGLAVIVSRKPLEVAVAAGGDGKGVLAVEAAHLPWATAQRLQEHAEEAGVRVIATTGLVEELRVVKDDAEVARLAAACAFTTAALGWLIAEVVAVGRTERQLAVALERRFVDIGADGVAFPSIVASGPNAAVPHHAPTDRAIVDGDVVTIDCGALVDGYHADCTRTVAVGRFDPEMGRVYEVVREAQAAGRDAAVAGALAGDVDAAARDVIERGGMGDRFVHGTGHGVGLAIHEAPAVAKGSRDRLLASMTLTVEPGVYLPGIGGVRIEDTIVVTADGPARVLTDL